LTAPTWQSTSHLARPTSIFAGALASNAASVASASAAVSAGCPRFDTLRTTAAPRHAPPPASAVLAETQGACYPHNANSKPAPTDVRRRDDVSALVKLACERYGKLDILVSNAGIGPLAPLDDLHVKEWEDTIRSASTAGLISKPNQAVYSGTKFAVRAISEGLRQEAGDKLRVTIISPGFVRTNLAESVNNPEVKAQIAASMDSFAIPADAIARAIAFAIEQPANVDVGEIIVRPTAQG
jgi:NADP-dependent 3-hydroxy acid dehydrogenase YdfG